MGRIWPPLSSLLMRNPSSYPAWSQWKKDAIGGGASRRAAGNTDRRTRVYVSGTCVSEDVNYVSYLAYPYYSAKNMNQKILLSEWSLM